MQISGFVNRYEQLEGTNNKMKEMGSRLKITNPADTNYII
jgi:hypothetical protein